MDMPLVSFCVEVPYLPWVAGNKTSIINASSSQENERDEDRFRRTSAHLYNRVRGLVVMIVACQVMDPGSIPGERTFIFSSSYVSV